MTQNPKLENYLSALEKALGQIPISDRVDIVTEIKSHVLDAMEKDPNNSIDNILASLGEPQIVANRYLMERGLKPVKPSRAGMVIKWLVIGFLGTIGIFTLFVLVLIWKFTPIVKVNDQSGHVEILGGMINVESDGFPTPPNIPNIPKMYGMQWMHGVNIPGMHGMKHFNFNNIKDKSIIIQGAKDIDTKKIGEVVIDFENAQVELVTAPNNKLSWNCRTGKNGDIVKVGDRKVKIDLTEIEGGICAISIPEKIKTTVKGENGLLNARPKFEMDVKMQNGMVILHPENMEYKYDLNVEQGLINGMERYNSSEKKTATKIKINVEQGMIQVD